MKKHRCGSCRRVTHAERPLGTAGSFGTDLEAIIAALTVRFHMSRLDAVELCRTVFGVTISVGSMQVTCERMGDSISSTVQGMADHVATAAVAHADETGWYIRGKLVWMWAALTEQAECFRVDMRRNRRHEEAPRRFHRPAPQLLLCAPSPRASGPSASKGRCSSEACGDGVDNDCGGLVDDDCSGQCTRWASLADTFTTGTSSAWKAYPEQVHSKNAQSEAFIKTGVF